MNNYYFKINAVDVHVEKDGLQKVIYNVHYSYVVEDADNNTDTIVGTCELEEPDSVNFKEFDQIIQEDVINWIEPLVNVEAMKQTLDIRLQEKIKPSKLIMQVPISLNDEPETIQ